MNINQQSYGHIGDRINVKLLTADGFFVHNVSVLRFLLPESMPQLIVWHSRYFVNLNIHDFEYLEYREVFSYDADVDFDEPVVLHC